MPDKTPLLIDTDPGVDDALAILMAFNDPAHAVVGLTVCAGNVGLGHTVANALKLCEIAGRTDVPVFAGASEPLVHAAPDAAHVHGEDGFGDVGYVPAARMPEAEHAAQAIVRLSHAHAGELLLVALGPLTNLALALRRDPSLPERIGRLVVMGGAVTGQGNITPAAEFNVYFDPEAADIVLRAFPRYDLCDWEATLGHGLHHESVDQWLQVDSPRARFYEAISRRTRSWSADRRGDHWHSADGLAMAFALAPEAATETDRRPLQVVLGDGPERGLTRVDWRNGRASAGSATILRRYDESRCQALIASALSAH
jgi:purine nucleosidase